MAEAGEKSASAHFIVKRTDLFGGERPWNSSDWTASDDRVRGGNSHSYLDCSASSALFHGTLDIETLGGAGFASQRTTSTDKTWDVSTYNGVLLEIDQADEKSYTFILKDNLLPQNPSNGREQATISYEYDFVPSQNQSHQTGSPTTIYIPWNKLKPTYRGKEKKDAEPINLKNIKRFSIMMRSFFGTQHGPFNLSIRSISAISLAKLDNHHHYDQDSAFPHPYTDDPHDESPRQYTDSDDAIDEKASSSLLPAHSGKTRASFSHIDSQGAHVIYIPDDLDGDHDDHGTSSSQTNHRIFDMPGGDYARPEFGKLLEV
ncbi:CIA30-domain-containing protein [Xylona heveae TC161]|uniref:CIA30-domain-containing protein n=1 Tax=Xylona heveae (strain CBS 132557 / TC161) TaxID=1328760 RepID=A0A165JMF7_XYLHT|nr:CIA30-domain-containing protein [Xylona heveae TC161]KZF26423.1 CIA30-domain-containing protein [Xylona heveae TC161]